MHKRFSEEVKKSVIVSVQNGESQLSVASSLGISYKTLNRWVIQRDCKFVCVNSI